MLPADVHLIQECIARNRHAQKLLYDRYKDAMFTIALRISKNPDDASDALQDSFIQVFRDLSQFTGKSTLGAWIKTIVIRTAVRNMKLLLPTESMDEVNANEQLVWPEGLNGEYLHQAIQTLPEGYKLVFLLIEVEGYTHQEVAEILGIAVGTSKSQLFKSKKMLQEKLKQIMS